MEMSHSNPPCGENWGEGKPPSWYIHFIDKYPYLYFGVQVWGITGAVTMVVSLCTDPIPQNRQHR